MVAHFSYLSLRGVGDFMNPASSSLRQSSVMAQRNLTFSRLPLPAIALLLISGSFSLLWSHYKLLAGDEFYEVWTDSAPSIRQLFDIQRNYPVALDPFAYHAIAHAAIRVFGVNAFAIRLPSILGVLLMQVCLFVFLRRISTERVALFALGFTAFTCTPHYSIEGRPYGLMLGLFGLAMVSWQTAVRREKGRTIALVILALSITVALNTHYFGILLLIPLCIAELFRALKVRRFDFPMFATIGAGAAGILFVLPFMKAAREFHSAYGSWNMLKLKAIGWTYLWVLSNHSGTLDRVIFAVVLICVCVALWASIYRLRSMTITQLEPDEVFIVAITALPLFGFLLAWFNSSVLEPRFVIAVVIGISALTASGIFSLFPSDRAKRFILTTLFLAIASTGFAHIYLERIAAEKTLSSMALSPEIKAELTTSPNKELYIQDIGMFGSATFYEPDPNMRSRLVLVYSADQEIKWNQENVISATAIHLSRFTHLKTIPYESLTMQSGSLIFVDYDRALKTVGWNWLAKAFDATHAEVKPLGSAFCGNCEVMGDVVSVRFHP